MGVQKELPNVLQTLFPVRINEDGTLDLDPFLFKGNTIRYGQGRIDPATKCRLQLTSLSLCSYCGKTLTDDDFTIDHVIPRPHGGTNSIFNLVECCNSCNNRKGDIDLFSFLNLLE